MLFHHVKVPLKVFSILFKIHSARCVCEKSTYADVGEGGVENVEKIADVLNGRPLW